MLAFLKALVLLPVALLVILLAVANRSPVLLSLDPFSRGAPELGISLPLYVLLFAAVALGVVVGGVGAWLSAGRTRQVARTSRREAHRLREETDRLRATLADPGQPALPRPRHAI